jgi:hypothetical protein
VVKDQKGSILKTRMMTIRFTEEEYDKLLTLSDGFPVSEYVRERLFGANPRRIGRPAKPEAKINEVKIDYTDSEYSFDSAF